jgi:ABC-2 type transport system ATP-binding protein
MINLDTISFSYRKKSKAVLQKISLDIPKGRICGLLGKNGEGKTTLLSIMSGMLFPDSGKCKVLGFEPAKRLKPMLEQIFLLPEEIFLPEVTARRYFEMYKPFYPRFSEETLRTCIESFEIDVDARLQKMSLGQKKKTAIALALAANTPVLLMDEPTNGLDIPSKSIFRRLLAASMNDKRVVIISTHQVRDLESLIDTVIILDNREIILNSPLEEIGAALSFGLVEEGEKTLYDEPSPMGRMGVTTNKTGEAGLISLELLFNAAVQSKAEVREMFKTKKI